MQRQNTRQTPPERRESMVLSIQNAESASRKEGDLLPVPQGSCVVLLLHKKTRVKQIFKENLQSKRIMLLLMECDVSQLRCVCLQVRSSDLQGQLLLTTEASHWPSFLKRQRIELGWLSGKSSYCSYRSSSLLSTTPVISRRSDALSDTQGHQVHFLLSMQLTTESLVCTRP